MGRMVKNLRRRARTRISTKHQVTIPSEAMKSAGLQAGDVLEVEATGRGTVEFRRAVNPFQEAAGTLTGVFPPGHLDELRDEWE